MDAPQFQQFVTPEEAAAVLAKEIATLIRSRLEEGAGVSLGLAAGASPLPLYSELVRLHHVERLSFRRVTLFALDEYYPIAQDDPGSFHRYFSMHLFEKVDLDRQQIHLLDGSIPPEDLDSHLWAYEEQLRASGGIDLQILGIGKNGHIGFNEPGSPIDSRTRCVALDEETRQANASAFGSVEKVPHQALTMGIATIREARALRLLAPAAGKMALARRALKEPSDPAFPASLLQGHPDFRVLASD